MAKYFAQGESAELADTVLGKVSEWSNTLRSNGYIDKLRKAWAAYYGAYYTTASSGHQITFGGSNGELAQLPVNDLRNLGQHILNMCTATRPVMEARASNTDYKSLSQTKLANGLLDYYMREKRMEYHLRTAVESAIVMGSGFIKMDWNSTTGEVYDFNEETNTEIREGDVEFTNVSAFDVVYDFNKEDQNHDWVCVRSWKNKHDLIAKYPELEDKLEGIQTKSQVDNYKFIALGSQESDEVAVYEFYHKRSEALPDGRYIMFCTKDSVMYDGPMPYRNIPVFRIAPSDILGTPFGYTNLFDLMPLQEALNSLYTTVLSNQNAFGVQSIIVPRGADINISELTSGLNIIEANMQAGKPEALNLTQTPAEVFKFMEMLDRKMETLSGVNQVARGNPEASLKSGAALALIQSMAIQFMNGLQQSYVRLIEDVGTGLIHMLRDFAAVPRVAAIVGKSNKAYMKEFKGDDLDKVNRVIVDVGNPMARTTAGRMQIAQEMLQMGLIKNPQQYITLINTGSLDMVDDSAQNQLLLIKGENEQMVDGQQVIMIATDEHKLHILEHSAVLSDPDLRRDPQLVQNVLNHIQEHIDALSTVNPQLLMQLGQQPIQPPPPAPGANPMQPPMPGQPQNQGPQETVQPGVAQAMPNQELPNMPNVPSPPAPFENNPTNPANVPLGG